MKKTKFSVIIYGDCYANSDLLKCVALHNEGKVNLSLTDLQAYVRVNKTLLPLSWADIEAFTGIDSLEVWDNGECRLMIEETEHYELQDDAEAMTQANGFGALADG